MRLPSSRRRTCVGSDGTGTALGAERRDSVRTETKRHQNINLCPTHTTTQGLLCNAQGDTATAGFGLERRTWRTDHLGHVHNLRGLHRLGRYDGWVKRRSLKLQHGVLKCGAKAFKRTVSTVNASSLETPSLLPPLTCMKLYVPCICSIRSCTTCFRTRGSLGGEAGAGDPWLGQLSRGRAEGGGCTACCCCMTTTA